MASQSRSQRRRQQQRARAQQRPAAPPSRRPVDKSPSPSTASLAAPAEITELEDEAESVATSAVREDVALPTAPLVGQRSHSAGRGAPERETAAGASARRQRRAARLAVEPVDYTLDYEVARHDLRRIAILAALLLAAMVALRVSGVL